MPSSIINKKLSRIDRKIDQFCHDSAELLENIHARCNNTAGPPAKGKRGRKKKAKEDPEMSEGNE